MSRKLLDAHSALLVENALARRTAMDNDERSDLTSSDLTASASASSKKKQRNERERRRRACNAVAAGRQPGVAGRPRAVMSPDIVSSSAVELTAAGETGRSVAEREEATAVANVQQQPWPSRPSSAVITLLDAEQAALALSPVDPYVLRVRSHFDALDALPSMQRPRKPPRPDVHGGESDAVWELRNLLHGRAVQLWDEHYLRPWQVRSKQQPSIPPDIRRARRYSEHVQRHIRRAAEDRIIQKLHGSEGPAWTKIAQALPGRTPASVRNRFLRITKGEQLLVQAKVRKNACNHCGLVQQNYGHVCSALLKHLELDGTAAQTTELGAHGHAL